MENMNPVNWFEIATNDLERAKKFYSTVFGSEFESMEMPEMKMYMFAGKQENPGAMGALVNGQQLKPSADGSTVYFFCDDIANELTRVPESGGQVIVPKTSIGENGFIAQVMDTEGNRIGLHSVK